MSHAIPDPLASLSGEGQIRNSGTGLVSTHPEHELKATNASQQLSEDLEVANVNRGSGYADAGD